MSLYPYVMSNREFPLGDPDVITNVDNLPWTKSSDVKYRGFVLCHIIPPKKLKIPTLHYSCKDRRLVFPLCRTCAEEKLYNCDHNEDERSWTAGYTTAEIEQALSDGCSVDEVHEIWHYKAWTDALFKEYIMKYMVMKIENSGWGSCSSPDEKEAYLADIKANCGIDLNPDKIEFNPGKRFVAKIMCKFFLMTETSLKF